MDGKGRALDNIYIERFWRTNHQHIYLKPAGDGISLYRGIIQWMDRNHNRKHQTINEKPIIIYKNAA